MKVFDNLKSYLDKKVVKYSFEDNEIEKKLTFFCSMKNKETGEFIRYVLTVLYDKQEKIYIFKMLRDAKIAEETLEYNHVLEVCNYLTRYVKKTFITDDGNVLFIESNKKFKIEAEEFFASIYEFTSEFENTLLSIRNNKLDSIYPTDNLEYDYEFEFEIG